MMLAVRLQVENAIERPTMRLFRQKYGSLFMGMRCFVLVQSKFDPFAAGPLLQVVLQMQVQKYLTVELACKRRWNVAIDSVECA